MNQTMDEMLTDLSGRVRVRPPRPARPVGEIITRGRRLKTHRRVLTGTAALGATALAGAALAMAQPAGVAPSRQATGAVPSVAQTALAAWAVQANPDDTVTVTVHELFDADHLRDALARAGVRAVVQFSGPRCRTHVQQIPVGPGLFVGMPVLRHVNGAVVFTIDRAMMPAGSVLSLYLNYGEPTPGAGTNRAAEEPITVSVVLFSGYPDCESTPSAMH